MTARNIRTLIDTVQLFYKEHGRHDLPWRKTKNPYRILVSEMMLQQTQVPRVIPKYQSFLKQFPSIEALAEAPLHEVLTLWQGLGYNRRAKFLHDCAKTVVREYDGKIPTDIDTLCTLPGIGPYTARAICAFSKNKPVVLIETNVRTVFLHHLFPNKKNIADNTLLPFIDEVIQAVEDPRSFYWGLMDYGSYLKAQGIRTHRNSKHYSKQSKFKGSDREVRGAILRVLTEESNATVGTLVKKTGMEKDRIKTQLQKLEVERFVQKQKQQWRVTE